MRLAAGVFGTLLVAAVLVDTFETIILPWHIGRRRQPSRFFVRAAWRVWSAAGNWMTSTRQRESYLCYYGPLATVLVLAMWAIDLVVGFALLQFSFGSRLVERAGTPNFTTDLYMSGTTFFTLGLGDVSPLSGAARTLTVQEVGIGAGFLTLLISYLPVLNQTSFRIERSVRKICKQAGSPPCAVGILAWLGRGRQIVVAGPLLAALEEWSAELMDCTLAFPILAFYRSKRQSQSWLAALTVTLDLSALASMGLEGIPTEQGRLTLASAQQCAVDLTRALEISLHAPYYDRLPPSEIPRLREMLQAAGTPLRDPDVVERELVELHQTYEPYLAALSRYLVLPLPPWLPPWLPPNGDGDRA